MERQVAGGPVTVHTGDGGRVDADEILVGTGRCFSAYDIGLDTTGLRADGPLEVDASMRATAVADGWLYAVGDVNGRNLLTHLGKYQARVCGDVIAARANGFNVRTVEYEIGEVAGAIVRGVGNTGRAKLVVDEDRRVLLGATFVARTWPTCCTRPPSR